MTVSVFIVLECTTQYYNNWGINLARYRQLLPKPDCRDVRLVAGTLPRKPNLPNRGVPTVARKLPNEAKPDFCSLQPVAGNPPRKHLLYFHPTPQGADGERVT
ncbi:hypothetical protein GCM10027423_42910 [Spirosoma arcticum]